MRSNPVVATQHTYVTLPALDCRAGLTCTYLKRSAARNDGLLTPYFFNTRSNLINL
ncbi:MAG: hypothetical protein LBM98_08405 [Oscillospiraceae bacterium]|nr:hypothetical protein [Oscillospiraceae bacterium]